MFKKIYVQAFFLSLFLFPIKGLEAEDTGGSMRKIERSQKAKQKKSKIQNRGVKIFLGGVGLTCFSIFASYYTFSADNKRLLAENKRLSQKDDKLFSKNKQLAQEKEKLEAANGDLAEKAKSLEQDIESLKSQQQATLSEKGALKQEVKSLKSQQQLTLNEKETLKQEVERLGALKESILKGKKKLQDRLEAIHQLEEKEEQVKKLRKEESELAKSIGILKDQENNHKEEEKHLELQLKGLCDELEQLRNRKEQEGKKDIDRSFKKAYIAFDNHYISKGDPKIITEKDTNFDNSKGIFDLIKGFAKRTSISIPDEITGLIYLFRGVSISQTTISDEINAISKDGRFMATLSGTYYQVSKQTKKPELYKTLTSLSEIKKDDFYDYNVYLSRNGQKVVFVEKQYEKALVVVIDVEKDEAILPQMSCLNVQFKADANILLIQERDKILLWHLEEHLPIKLSSLPDKPTYKREYEPRISLDRKIVMCSFLNEKGETYVGVWHLGKGDGKIAYRQVRVPVDNLNGLNIQLSPNGDCFVGLDEATKLFLGWKLDVVENKYMHLFTHYSGLYIPPLNYERHPVLTAIRLYSIKDETYLSFCSHKKNKKNGYLTFYGKLTEFKNYAERIKDNPLTQYKILLCHGSEKMLLEDQSGTLKVYNKGIMQPLKRLPQDYRVNRIIDCSKACIFILKERETTANRYRTSKKVILLNSEWQFLREIKSSYPYKKESEYSGVYVQLSRSYQYVAIAEDLTSVDSTGGSISSHTVDVTFCIYTFKELLNNPEPNPVYRLNVPKYLKSSYPKITSYYLNSVQAMDNNKFMVDIEYYEGKKSLYKKLSLFVAVS